MGVNRKVKTIPATLTKFTATPITEQKKRRTAGYARVSTDHDDQFTSYAAQIDYYTNYIKGRDDWEFVDVYTDEGITGTSTKRREGFKNMIADALDGKIDLIVTKSVSRFARNTVDSLTTIRKLKEKGVEVYFEKEYIETALYLILTPNTGLFFVYCSIYCGFVGISEPVHCGLSLICRLNLQVDTER